MNKAQQLSTVLVLCAGVTPLAAEDYEMRLCKRVEVKPGQFRMAVADNDTWTLQGNDFEKDIWSHPIVADLANTCPDGYDWLRKNLIAVQKNGTFKDVLDAYTGTTACEATCSEVRLASAIRRHSAGDVSPEGPARPSPTLQ